MIVEIDGAGITSWDTFHQVFAARLGFPDFYGRNMNAWIDCMTHVDEDSGMSAIQVRPGEILRQGSSSNDREFPRPINDCVRRSTESARKAAPGGECFLEPAGDCGDTYLAAAVANQQADNSQMSKLGRTLDDAHMGGPADFSLVLGGPLFQLWRRSHLAGSALELLHRRVLVFVGLTWVPLLLLSVAEGRARGQVDTLPFIYDVELHVRLLCALPLLILAEWVVHQRLRPIVQQFLSRGLIPDAQRGTFDAAVTSALRLRNSVTAEVLLIALVLVVGTIVTRRTQIAQASTTWYASPFDTESHATLAGQWLRWISLPVFQFVFLRWYFRLFIWGRFLWQVSRIDLKLMPTHPDGSGGIGFVAGITNAFVPVLSAQGAVLAGMMANRILYAGATLPQFKLELIGLVGVMVFAVLGPLLVFSPALAAAKRQGSREYGILAQRYVREFEQKWLRGGAPPDEPLIGSADVQSLADMGGSYDLVKNMRWVPFTLHTVLQLAIATLLPVLPLTLTLISLEELVDRLLKVIF